jgi:hypothetical protein
MILGRLHIQVISILAILVLLVAQAQGAAMESTSVHSLSASFNVALVQVSQDFTEALGVPASPVVFDENSWTIVGLQGSSAIHRYSSIGYTLAHKAGGTANTVSVVLSLTDGSTPAAFAALKVTLLVSEGTARSGVIASPVILKGYDAAPTAQTIIQTTDATKGVAAQNVPLKYTFEIDVTQGPAFPDSTLTFIYTTTAEAP